MITLWKITKCEDPCITKSGRSAKGKGFDGEVNVSTIFFSSLDSVLVNLLNIAFIFKAYPFLKADFIEVMTNLQTLCGYYIHAIWSYKERSFKKPALRF